MFLTTQYLEEADALADRVGIIDRGRIVAEGTPTQLKDEIGSPSVEIEPADASAGATFSPSSWRRFGPPTRNGRGSVSVQLPEGEAQLAEIVRALDRAGLKVASLQLHQPSLDDVFLAKTGRKLEGAGERGSRCKPAAAAGAVVTLAADARSWTADGARREQRARPGRRGRAPLDHAHRAPARPARVPARVSR